MSPFISNRSVRVANEDASKNQQKSKSNPKEIVFLNQSKVRPFRIQLTMRKIAELPENIEDCFICVLWILH